MNRQDAKALGKAGSGGIERDRGTGSGHHGLGAWRLGGSCRPPQPRRPPAEPATLEPATGLDPAGRLSRWCARLYGRAPELMAPPRPTGGITAAQDRVRRRAVAAALAPWQQAIAAAPGKSPCTSRRTPPRGAGVPEAHAPIPGAAGRRARLEAGDRRRAPASRRRAPGKAPCTSRRTPGARRRRARSPCTNSRRRRACRRRPPGEAPCTSRRTPRARRRRARSPCTNSRRRRACRRGAPGEAPCTSRRTPRRAAPACQKPMHQFPAPPTPATTGRGWPNRAARRRCGAAAPPAPRRGRRHRRVTGPALGVVCGHPRQDPRVTRPGGTTPGQVPGGKAHRWQALVGQAQQSRAPDPPGWGLPRLLLGRLTRGSLRSSQ